MLKDKYVLDNRYGDLVQLIKQDGNIYLLDGDLGYMRVGYNDDKSINFVDPSGGPFMRVGAEWDDFTIEAINSITNVGFLFTLSERKNVLD
jgi:hypothetical protein